MKANKLTDADIQFVSLVDSGAHQNADIVLAKRATTTKSMTLTAPVGSSTNYVPVTTSNTYTIPNIIVTDKSAPEGKNMAEKDKLEKEGEEAEATEEEAPTEEAETEEAPAEETPAEEEAPKEARHVEPEKASLLKAYESKIAKLEADAQAQAAAIEKMQEEKRVATWVDKAESYPRIGQAEYLGDLLAKIEKGTPEVVEAIEEIFTKANEGLKNLTLEIGGNGGADDASVVKARIQKIRDASPDLTEHQALLRALESDPGLYGQLSNK